LRSANSMDSEDAGKSRQGQPGTGDTGRGTSPGPPRPLGALPRPRGRWGVAKAALLVFVGIALIGFALYLFDDGLNSGFAPDRKEIGISVVSMLLGSLLLLVLSSMKIPEAKHLFKVSAVLTVVISTAVIALSYIRYAGKYRDQTWLGSTDVATYYREYDRVRCPYLEHHDGGAVEAVYGRTKQEYIREARWYETGIYVDYPAVEPNDRFPAVAGQRMLMPRKHLLIIDPGRGEIHDMRGP